MNERSGTIDTTKKVEEEVPHKKARKTGLWRTNGDSISKDNVEQVSRGMATVSIPVPPEYKPKNSHLRKNV